MTAAAGCTAYVVALNFVVIACLAGLALLLGREELEGPRIEGQTFSDQGRWRVVLLVACL
jgi:hypothetical protein